MDPRQVLVLSSLGHTKARDQPRGIAEYVLEGLTDQWRRYEVPFGAFKPREAGGHLDWRSINHFGIAMIAPQSAESGTFWVDNIRAEEGVVH